MWRCAASLERLAPEAEGGARDCPGQGARAARHSGGHVLWCLGRLGARVPLYGPANTVVRDGGRRALDQGSAQSPVRPRP